MRTFVLTDDDLDDADLFKEALEKVNPEIGFEHAKSGEALFAYLNNTNVKPSIIFMDLNMPEMSGWQCLTKILSDKRYNDIPVIMYTTSSNPRERNMAHQLGAKGLIIKPGRFNVLQKILDKLVQTKTADLSQAVAEIAVLYPEF